MKSGVDSKHLARFGRIIHLVHAGPGDILGGGYNPRSNIGLRLQMELILAAIHGAFKKSGHFISAEIRAGRTVPRDFVESRFWPKS